MTTNTRNGLLLALAIMPLHVMPAEPSVDAKGSGTSVPADLEIQTMKHHPLPELQMEAGRFKMPIGLECGCNRPPIFRSTNIHWLLIWCRFATWAWNCMAICSVLGQIIARYEGLDVDDAAFPTFANPATSAPAARAWAVG